MEHLLEKLKLYSETDFYPYHMPGHKRNAFGELPEDLYSIDITEIDGFDNLHQAEDVLKNLQEEAAELYGAEESFYLVNGSTCGILAAISAAVPEQGHILITRNCHKAVYHAAYLRNLTISYLYPEVVSEYDICDAIKPEQVREALDRQTNVDAVLIVSPTYEGRIANVREIASIVHERGIPLIVDEAHGAHLGFAEGFAQNSCRCGADMVIHSVHKTLPAMTQTALLHVNGKLVNRDVLKRFLRIYQTSSPSYVLMSSIDNALQYIQKQGTALFNAFKEQFVKMCGTLTSCKQISCLCDDWNCQDVGKLVISTKGTGLSGKELYTILRDEYHLQLEMAAETYVLAMFTINDMPEAYTRMEEALLEIDARIQQTSYKVSNGSTYDAIPMAKRVYPMKYAWDADSEWVTIDEALNRPVGEFVNLYPPGIPLLVPGECFTKEFADRIQEAVRQNLTVQGIQFNSVTDTFPVLQNETAYKKQDVVGNCATQIMIKVLK